MLQDESRVEAWQNYTADYLWGIRADIHGMTGDIYEAARYTELIHPEFYEKDNRTAEQIKDDLLSQLTS